MTSGDARAPRAGRPARFTLPLIGLIVSAASVVVLVRLVSPAEIVAAWRAADLRYMGVFALLLLAGYPLRSYRWSLVLQPVATPSWLDVLSATAVGLLGNTLLPARAGDIGRGLLIGRKAGIEAVTALATVAGERLLDVAANLVILGVLAFVVGVPRVAELWGNRGPVLGPAMLAITVALFASSLASSLLLRRPPTWMTRLGVPSVITGLAAGLRVFSDRRTLSRAAAWTLVLWALLGADNYFGMIALGIRLPWHAAFVVMLAQTVGVAIPSSPAYVGTYHVATVLALSMYGIPPAASLPFAVITHATGVVLTIAAGLPFLWYEGLRGGDLWHVAIQPAASIS